MEGSLLQVIFLVVFCALIAIASLHLWYAKHKLNHHIHVNPLHKALPVHASLVYSLIHDLSSIAAIEPPDVFVYRSALPNAFVAAMPLRSELYLADELFEQADASHDPIQQLTQTLAHEIAHLKLNHAFWHGIYTYLVYLNIPILNNVAKSKLDRIEQEADGEGDKIIKIFQTLEPAT